MRITSLHNPHIKNCAKLQQRRERDRQQTMVIEGYRAILCAMQNNYPLTALYYSPELFYGEQEPALLQRAQEGGATLYEVAAEPFQKMSSAPRPDGLLALAPQIRRSLTEWRPKPAALFLIAEAVEKPSN